MSKYLVTVEYLVEASSAESARSVNFWCDEIQSEGDIVEIKEKMRSISAMHFFSLNDELQIPTRQWMRDFDRTHLPNWVNYEASGAPNADAIVWKDDKVFLNCRRFDPKGEEWDYELVECPTPPPSGLAEHARVAWVTHELSSSARS